MVIAVSTTASFGPNLQHVSDSRVSILDFANDPFRLLQPGSPLSLNSIADALVSAKSRASRVCVAIDSLSFFIAHFGLRDVLRLLHQIVDQQQCRVVALLHTDLHEDAVVEQVAYACAARIEVDLPPLASDEGMRSVLLRHQLLSIR